MVWSLLRAGLVVALSGVSFAAPTTQADPETHQLSKRAIFNLVNFRPEDASRVTKVNQGWTDSMALASAAMAALQNQPADPVNDAIFNHYFPAASKPEVLQTFNSIWINGQGSADFSRVYVNNEFNDKPIGNPPEQIPNNCKDNDKIGMVTWNQFHNRDYITACKRSFDFGSLNEVEQGHNICAKNEVIPEMISFGSMLLHEYTHVNLISVVHFGRRAIDDLVLPRTTEKAHGPVSTHLLKLDPTGARETTRNADHYAWFAIEAYWTQRCRPQLQQRNRSMFDAATRNCLANEAGGCLIM